MAFGLVALWPNGLSKQFVSIWGGRFLLGIYHAWLSVNFDLTRTESDWFSENNSATGMHALVWLR